MGKKVFFSAALVAAIALLFSVGVASAHQTVTAGDYQIEIGWVTEPPIVGQQNAVVVNVTKGQDESPVDDISGLVVTVSYAGQTKTLTLQPLGEDTPGQYVAPILPTIAGEYTVDVIGKLGDQNVNVEVQPEEVDGADTLEFPSAAAQPQSGLGLTGWLAIAGLVFGLAGLALGLVNMQKKS